jgi:hypothetical protein
MGRRDATARTHPHNKPGDLRKLLLPPHNREARFGEVPHNAIEPLACQVLRVLMLALAKFCDF